MAAKDGYTPGSGAPVAADTVDGQSYEYVKLADATVDSDAPTGISGNPLRTQDDATATALASLLTELQQKLETGQPVELGATSLAALESITAVVSGTVAISAPPDQATTLTDGRKTSTTPGTAVAIRAALVCKWVTVTALVTNTQQVNVGGSGVLGTLGASTGTPLLPGGSISLPVDNASKVFIDPRVSGEGVSFTVGS
jgi:hypothetical protein